MSFDNSNLINFAQRTGDRFYTNYQLDPQYSRRNHRTSENDSFQREVELIASVLKNSWNFNRVVIDNSGTQSDQPIFRCKSVVNWRQMLPDFFAPFLDQTYQQENRSTINYLYKKFGKERIRKISAENDLSIEYKYNHGLPLQRRDIEIIFLNMGMVTFDTLQKIFTDIQNSPNAYLHLSREKVSQLRRDFQSKQFNQLKKHHLDELYAIASPFMKIDTYFLNNPPNLKAPIHEFWGNENGKRKMIYLLEDIHRKTSVQHQVGILDQRQTLQLECNFRKIKKIVTYCIPKNLVIAEPEGYRYVFSKIEGGGSYQIFLKALNKSEEMRSQVCHLPTQSWHSAVHARWESMMEDMRPEIGAFGIMTTYEETKEMLYNPHRGFIDDSNEKVDVIGHSLGGTAAQRFYALFYEKTHTIIGVNCPGVDAETANFFKDRINASSSQDAMGRKIMYIRDVEDIITYGGAAFLGKYCDHCAIEVQAHLIKPVANESEIQLTVHREYVPEGWFAILKKLKEAFANFHGRDTTLGRYRIFSYSNRHENARNHLNTQILDNEPFGWEDKRKRISRILFGEPGERGFRAFLQEHTTLPPPNLITQ